MNPQSEYLPLGTVVPGVPTTATLNLGREYTLNERALLTFWRDLPRLLEERYHQWVGYHGEQCLGFANSRTELWQECLKRGMQPDEFLIRSIEPEDPDLTLDPPMDELLSMDLPE